MINDEGGMDSLVRQDAWNQDDDLLLAEVVLRYIREGGTQLAAFEEVGEKLSRTPAACGFRWNSTIRKKYESAIQLAKKHKKQMKKEELVQVLDEESLSHSTSTSLGVVESGKIIIQTIDEMVKFLQEKKEECKAVQSSRDTIFIEEYEELLEKNKSIEKELYQLKREYELIKKDYLLMINVMERASRRNPSTSN